MSKQEVRDSLSTVVGDLSLTTRENQIGSLFLDVQSDEDFGFKVVKVLKSKGIVLNVLDESVCGFKFVVE
ncbi:putative uncharacterized conserved protein [Streptococcus pyogenes]|nr:hypothetical protein ETT50_01045 [Streptococcus pyogenes]VGQ45729.1 putative uncharacterized conserved protein [Streptococcus pyogenes]VGQ49562.1 putative uncharacterized conserved protein [Streptococcus pyogenes]VGU85653.1 putative uncharacterized conserved protein [Streptococcus pyogenes]VGV11730.1 putative uncharacterized conserved protein [Streptococcus pyogenes]